MTLKVLAINSFTTHGMASLKSAICILKEHVLPVPTVILNGLTNMPGVQKHNVNFHELLEGAFNLIAFRKQKIILYIGYLGKAEHAHSILLMIERYRNLIEVILVDPIAGDHGRLYIPEDVSNQLQHLVQKADIVFPNITELKFLTGFEPQDNQPVEIYLKSFVCKFPQTSLVITSLPVDDKTGILFYHSGHPFRYTHDIIPTSYGGTGDAFVALFIRYHFFENVIIEAALKLAADVVYDSILLSNEANSDELLLACD